MKSFAKKALSVIVALTMIFSVATTNVSAAKEFGTVLKDAGVGVVGFIVSTLLNAINFIVPDTEKIQDLDDYVQENFYAGTDSMLDEAADGAYWSLGYAKDSLVPDDWQEKDYYLGGFISLENGMSNNVEEVIDDMQVRVIAVSDNSGRGVAVFANIDSIGVSNYDIKQIREYLVSLNPGVELSTVTVTSTHCHSCIDTQGLWTDLLPKLGANLLNAYLPFREFESGVDSEYMEFLIEKTGNAMLAAINDMKAGTMTYAIKDLDNEYFNNKNRPSASAIMNELARFEFTPDDGSQPTMIVNIAAHPDVAGLAVDEVDNGRDLSGDYVYYMGEYLENANNEFGDHHYNFMFFNGAIAGMYEGRHLVGDGLPNERRYEETLRYGYEMAKIALNLTNSYEEIAASVDWDKINADMEVGGENYTLWFENWTAVEERELDPILNVLIREAKIKVNNPLIQLVGKLGLVNYNVYKDGFSYYTFVEIGYIEMGDVKIVLMPGEIVQDLVAGGDSLTADGSFSGQDFGYASIYELFGEDTICFGLANDAIGYVVPGNDYSLAILDGHYQELISMGSEAAAGIMQGFADIADEVN